MMRLLLNWILSALALLVVTYVVPGFQVDGFGSAMWAALVIGLLNMTLGLLLKLVTFNRDGSYHAAVSAFAIHHLPAQQKRRLFSELFTLLEPSGIFVNMDFVSVDGPLRGIFDEQMVANLVHAERESGGDRTAEQVERDFLQNKATHQDRPDTAEDQVLWLRDAGFGSAEVHFKWGESAVFGAIKPGEG